MKLIVIIPAYNEEKTIGTVIKSIPNKINGITKLEIIVVDDGGKDRTPEIARKSGALVVSHSTNKGVGAAFQTGIDKAIELKADIILNMDADGQFNPLDIPKLIQPIIAGTADMVTASRFKDKNLVPIMPLHKKIGNRLFSNLTSFLVGQKFYDTQCGFRAYSKKAALNLNLFGKFTYTQEAFIDLASKDIKIVEIPLKIRGVREFGKSKVANNVFKYGFRALDIMIKTVRDYKPLEFFGGIGFSVFSIGFVFGLFVFAHWLRTGATSPYTSMIPIGAVFLILGFLMMFLALIADMNSRIRRNQERILYELKRNGK